MSELSDISNLSRFFKPLVRSDRIHPNFTFRFGFCGIGEVSAASFVGVDIEQIHAWDDGEKIPLSVRKVWLYESGKSFPELVGFDGWSFRAGYLVAPSGKSYSPKEVEVALYLLQESNRNH